MKTRFMVFSLMICLSSLASAQNKGLGLGIILGEPTGLSGKAWLSNKTAVDAGLAWSFVKGSSMHIHADHLWHFFDALETEEISIPLYAGIGGRVKFGDKETGRVGVRIVGGLNYMVYSVPLDIFLEIAPVMDLVPATQVGVTGGVGARFFFRQRSE